MTKKDSKGQEDASEVADSWTYMRARSLQSCPTLCDSMDCSPPGSSVHDILQARILEWLPCPLPGDLPDPGMEPRSFMSPTLRVPEKHLFLLY